MMMMMMMMMIYYTPVVLLYSEEFSSYLLISLLMNRDMIVTCQIIYPSIEMCIHHYIHHHIYLSINPRIHRLQYVYHHLLFI